VSARLCGMIETTTKGVSPYHISPLRRPPVGSGPGQNEILHRVSLVRQQQRDNGLVLLSFVEFLCRVPQGGPRRPSIGIDVGVRFAFQEKLDDGDVSTSDRPPKVSACMMAQYVWCDLFLARIRFQRTWPHTSTLSCPWCSCGWQHLQAQ
jgi:hypothetical protein